MIEPEQERVRCLKRLSYIIKLFYFVDMGMKYDVLTLEEEKELMAIVTKFIEKEASLAQELGIGEEKH